MRVCLLAHHGKADLIDRTLRDAGVEISQDPAAFDFDLVLVDSDHPLAPPTPHKYLFLRECSEKGIPIVLYPHGAPPDLDFDGCRPRFMEGSRPLKDIPISMRLVTGEGHAEIARRYGCKHRVEVVGWTFCEEVEASAGGQPPSSLLFAPIHPWADGKSILPMHRGANTAAYHEFINHPAERKTVRMFGTDDPNGIIERVEGVEYQQSDLGSALDVIDDHDAVISYGTLGYTALARGKPTVMIYPYPGHTDDAGNLHARNFDLYKDYVRYPASIGDAPLDKLFQRDVSTWKDLFVGKPLDAEKLVRLLSMFKANRAQRRKLARAR